MGSYVENNLLPSTCCRAEDSLRNCCDDVLCGIGIFIERIAELPGARILEVALHLSLRSQQGIHRRGAKRQITNNRVAHKAYKRLNSLRIVGAHRIKYAIPEVFKHLLGNYHLELRLLDYRCAGRLLTCCVYGSTVAVVVCAVLRLSVKVGVFNFIDHLAFEF